MGVWGTGIFQDDTACEVRDTLRELLAEGLNPREATARVLAEFLPADRDPGASAVVWLALAATQWKLGRLQPRVRARALAIIAKGTDVELWEPQDRKKRQAVLAKLAAQLRARQPAPKRLRVPREHSTSWQVGDLVRYRLRSGRFIVLRVHRLWPNNRRRTSFDPCVDIADWAGTRLPAVRVLARLPARAPRPGLKHRYTPYFLIAPSGGRAFPGDRLEVIARGVPLRQPEVVGMGGRDWKTFDAALAEGFGLT